MVGHGVEVFVVVLSLEFTPVVYAVIDDATTNHIILFYSILFYYRSTR